MGSCMGETIKPLTGRSLWTGPKMFSSQSISCLLLVVALSAKADAYGRRKQVDKVEESEERQSRGSSAEDLDISDRRTTSVEDFDISDRRTSSTEDFGVEVFDVTDFDILDRGKPSVEDFGGKESMKIQNFPTPRTPAKKSTEIKRRRVGSTSWSSWTFSQRPNFNFPTRDRVKTERPRSMRKMPDDHKAKRIVIFPCQDQNLSASIFPTTWRAPTTANGSRLITQQSY